MTAEPSHCEMQGPSPGGWEALQPKRRGVFRTVLPAQIGLAAIWFVLMGFAGADPMFLWLPGNYLLLDLYLIIRSGIRPPAWESFSLPAGLLLRFSHWLMVLSALFLGLLGTGIYERWIE